MGWQELLLILIVLLVIFGAGKLPQVGGAIGRGIRELRSEMQGSEGDTATDEAPAPSPGSVPPSDRQPDRPESRA